MEVGGGGGGQDININDKEEEQNGEKEKKGEEDDDKKIMKKMEEQKEKKRINAVWWCLTFRQHASVCYRRICHTEIEVSDQKFYLTQSQYTDAEPTSPSFDSVKPGVW